ncbi:MAG: TatD family hydrolase [Acidaminococcaceae bacterium]|nr:TatD family hydrolase [Acidaminococcaceae bacterium]
MSRLGIIDTHAHLDDGRFDADRAEVIGRLSRDMEAVITQGTTYGTSVASVRLAEQYDFIYAAVGWHPEDLAGIRDERYLADIERLAREHEKVVAIGEIGLDYYWKENLPRDVQLLRLHQQCELAASLDLPAVIHDREAHGDCLEFVQKEMPKGLRMVFHCFSGSLEMARELWKRGIYTGFGGSSTYKRNKKVREILAACPEDLYLLETDCPYLTPEPYRGRRNDPSYTEFIAKNAALVRGTTWEHIAGQSTKNALTLFTRIRQSQKK